MPFFAWITLPSVISGCHIKNLPVIQCSHSLTDLLTDCYQADCLTGQQSGWQLPCDLSMLSYFSFVFTSDLSITNSHLHSLLNLALYAQQLHLCWKLRQHTQFIFGAISWVLPHPFCTTIILVILLFVLNKGPLLFALRKVRKSMKSVWLNTTFGNFHSSWPPKCSLIHASLVPFL